ncbi:hypothetical protein KY285_019679 [Solanum tuberosum]|nr:hypothetical protein KY285_019679 [Solanum tuberosum]
MAELGALISRAAEESYEKCNSSNLSDSEKKIRIHKYIIKTKQRMLRLNVLLKWCQQVPLIQYSEQLSSSHDSCFTYAVDSLFFMYEGLLQQARAAIYDVPSAVEQRQGLKKLDVLVRSKLVQVEVPKDITEVKSFCFVWMENLRFYLLLDTCRCGGYYIWSCLLLSWITLGVMLLLAAAEHPLMTW